MEKKEIIKRMKSAVERQRYPFNESLQKAILQLVAELEEQS